MYNEVGIIRLKYVARSLGDSYQGKEDVTASIFERVIATLGFQKLSDETYLKMLKKRRARYMERIDQLQSEIEQDQQKQGIEHTSTSADSSVRS